MKRSPSGVGRSDRVVRSMRRTPSPAHRLEPGADRRRRLIQLPGGLAQRQRLRDTKEQAEVIQMHRSIMLSLGAALQEPVYPRLPGGTDRSGTEVVVRRPDGVALLWNTPVV